MSLLLSCSGGVDERANGTPTGDDVRIEPASLAVAARPGGCGSLHVTALTLQPGPSGAELYAALKNDGDSPTCSVAFSVDILGKDEQFLATGLGGLLMRRFYRLNDGSDTLAACTAPGDVGMVAITDLPADFAVTDAEQLLYRCNYWNLDVTAVGDIDIDDVRAQPSSEGVAFSGRLVNGLDVALPSPAVAVFPVNRVGRPLGMALSEGSIEVPAGGEWSFETDIVNVAGVDHDAYPAKGP